MSCCGSRALDYEGHVSEMAQVKRTVELRQRDVAMLKLMTEQYGFRLDELAVALGRHGDGGNGALSIWGVRQQVERWKHAGWVRSEVVLGVTWVTPTSKGMAQAGLRYPQWRMPATKLAHCHAINVVRLWYESSPERVARQGRWISERLLFSRRGQGDWHVPDAALVPNSGGPVWAVEVELTHKHRPRYSDEVLSRLPPEIVGVLYLCPPGLTERVRRDVTAAAELCRPGLPVHVRNLPDVSGLSYGGHGGVW